MVSRLDTMSRFAEPDEKEPEVYGHCYCCGEPLVEGQDIVTVYEYWYCDTDCLREDREDITLGE